MRKLHFDNRNLRNLAVDPNCQNSCRTVSNAFFSRVRPTPLDSPKVVAVSPSALALLGVDANQVREEEIALFLSGNELLPGSDPVAHCYAGHQFGSFAGQLGDGAAILLGEVINPDTNQRFELQLKGAGPTPYSRNGDGRKVLRSSIREFLASEALHWLGIPTTRAAACVTSSSTVDRDPFYDGRMKAEYCTVVTRVAPTFFRFGSLEIFKKSEGPFDRPGPSAGNEELRRQFIEHLLLYFPHLQGSFEEKVAGFFREVAHCTARLVSSWQTLGFVHGVLNTDNLSLLGLTIDYGPYAFLEAYDEGFTPNGSDGSARYAYAKQPEVCRWNLGKLGSVLEHLLPPEVVSEVVAEYDAIFHQTYQKRMRDKLGLLSNPRDEDEQLVKELFRVMSLTHADFTDSFVALTEFHSDLLQEKSNADELEDLLISRLVSRCATPLSIVNAERRKLRVHRLGMPADQIELLWAAVQGDGAQARQIFGESVPLDVVREEIGQEKKKLDLIMKAHRTINYHENYPGGAEQKAAKDRELWQAWLKTYLTRLSDREELGEGYLERRVRAMRSANPTIILRNWMAQYAIEAAEKGDYQPTRVLLDLLSTPYDEKYSIFINQDKGGSAGVCDVDGGVKAQFLRSPPSWADSLLCTCSS
eukprot:gene8462-9328_t